MQLVNPLLPCKELGIIIDHVCCNIEFIPALVTSWMCPVGSSNNELAIDRVRRITWGILLSPRMTLLWLQVQMMVVSLRVSQPKDPSKGDQVCVVTGWKHDGESILRRGIGRSW